MLLSATNLSRTFGPQFLISNLLKFIYSEKATKFCEISTVDLTVTTQDKSKVEISQKFVAFSEYMNFTTRLGIFFYGTDVMPPYFWGIITQSQPQCSISRQLQKKILLLTVEAPTPKASTSVRDVTVIATPDFPRVLEITFVISELFGDSML